MYKFEVEAISIEGVKRRILEAADEIRKGETKLEILPPTSPDVSFATPEPVATAPAPAPETKEKRTRRTKAEIEAAKNPAPQVESPFGAPGLPSVPPTPGVPPELPMVAPSSVAPLVTSPAVALVPDVAPPMPTINAVPTHSYASFKANLMVLLASLIEQGKIKQQYIADLNKHFGIKDIWEILNKEAECLELFNSFATWGFINKIEG